MPGDFYIEGEKEKIAIKDVSEEVAAIKNKCDDIRDQAGKLAGETPGQGSAIGNWKSGTATSGETGADVVTIGANDTRKKVHSLLLNISDFKAGAKVTIRLFMQVNGTERKVYNEKFKQGDDPDGLWIFKGTTGIHGVLRVEAASNKAADDGATMDYDYLLEAM